MKFRTKMSHLNVAADAGDPKGSDSQHHITAQCLSCFRSITFLTITSNTHNRNTYCGVLLMDFQQHVDIITEWNSDYVALFVLCSSSLILSVELHKQQFYIISHTS
jgi:hypothetical protein